MTVVRSMDNIQNRLPAVGINNPAKSCSDQPQDEPERKKSRSSEKEVLESELITGRRRSRRGRPSQCTEFWLNFKANIGKSENGEYGEKRDGKSRWTLPPKSPLGKDGPQATNQGIQVPLSSPSPSISSACLPKMDIKGAVAYLAVCSNSNTISTAVTSNLQQLTYNTLYCFSQASQIYQKMKTMSAVQGMTSLSDSDRGLKRKVKDDREDRLCFQNKDVIDKAKDLDKDGFESGHASNNAGNKSKVHRNETENKIFAGRRAEAENQLQLHPVLLPSEGSAEMTREVIDRRVDPPSARTPVDLSVPSSSSNHWPALRIEDYRTQCNSASLQIKTETQQIDGNQSKVRESEVPIIYNSIPVFSTNGGQQDNPVVESPTCSEVHSNYASGASTIANLLGKVPVSLYWNKGNCSMSNLGFNLSEYLSAMGLPVIPPRQVALEMDKSRLQSKIDWKLPRHNIFRSTENTLECLNLSDSASVNPHTEIQLPYTEKKSKGRCSYQNSWYDIPKVTRNHNMIEGGDVPEDLRLRALDLTTSKVPLDLSRYT